MPTRPGTRRREPDIAGIARSLLGIDALRPGQEAAIRSVLDGRDTLVVMPTGSGKSAIYQIAGQVLGGLVIVVSPLIALQRDQVDSLDDSAGLRAAELNSTLGDSEREALFDAIRRNPRLFLFLAPEQLANEETLARLAAARPTLFVVDEAHCISEWGHDFRPDYLRLGAFLAQLGHPTTLALTATAAQPVREEIVQRLGMREPNILVRGFDRPNIHLAVRTFREEADKREALLEQAAAATGPGIIYAARRRDTEAIAAALAGRGVRAAAYHAGLRASEREAIQAAFMAGETDVMVATIAFGMGIDKPDIRYVYHDSVSDSLDTYYQEFGRAGRDGAPAEALLFYDPEDLGLRRFQSGVGELKAENVRPVLHAIRAADGPLDPAALREELDLQDTELIRVLGRLEDVGAVTIAPTGEVEATDSDLTIAAAAEAAERAQAQLQRFASSRLEMMRQYAETTTCRRAFLLNYFGEAYEGPCGNCDTCEAGTAQATTAEEPFPLQSTVVHSTWGEGTVMHYENGNVVVLFREAGYRTLSLDLVREEGLLRPAPDARAGTASADPAAGTDA